MVVFDLNQPAISEADVEDVSVVNSSVLCGSSSSNTGCESVSSHDNASSSNSVKSAEDVFHHELIETSDGSCYWVPRVSESVLPVVGSVFDSLDECIEMYRKYASEGGFGVRLSTSKRLLGGYVKQKYIVCNREGCPKGISFNTLNPKKGNRRVRNSNFRICDCKARVVFDMVPNTGKYFLATFDMLHNHELDRVEYKHLSKAERKLTYSEQLFIIKAALANIGSVRAHNLYTGLKGSSSLVHGTKTEFKNFTRGVNCFIGDNDAQMLIDRMNAKMEFTKDFSFYYYVDDAEICGLFWADEVAKRNYREFGDIISFDATYKTNRYKMVFVPFTAIDNHRKSVTIGSGLLKKETTESYIFLLQSFKKAFIRTPNIVVTDQDGSMRKAVAAEFPDSKHRLCMWHIMQKIPSKVVSRIYDETDFKDKFDKIVWNMFIGPEEFEDKWNRLMEEFDLVNHKWLSKMYRIRSSWIPAFFVDSPLCGLMRTTSRSESENSFFSYFTSSGATLVKFMLCYESAMERQRDTQEKLDFESFDTFPTLLTPLDIEEHASRVYTRSLFVRLQKQIVLGSWVCSISGMNTDEGCVVCIIDEESRKPVDLPEVVDDESISENAEEEINLYRNVTGHYKVLYNKGDNSVSCSCQLFIRCGILCRHIFCVFKNFKVTRIPDQYILRRWTKDLIPPDLRKNNNRYGNKNEAIEKLAVEASTILDSCLHILRNNEPKLSLFVNQMKVMKSKLEDELPIVPTRTISDFVEEFMGVKKPNKVKVKNPTGVRTKGCGKQKRIKSGREISMNKSKRKKGGCGICGSNSHNRRTCTANNEGNVLVPAAVVDAASDRLDGAPQDVASGSGSV